MTTLAETNENLGIVPVDKKGNSLPFPTGRKPYDFSSYWDTTLHNACFPNLEY